MSLSSSWDLLAIYQDITRASILGLGNYVKSTHFGSSCSIIIWETEKRLKKQETIQFHEFLREKIGEG